MDGGPSRWARLSREIGEMDADAHFTVVVVGTGYGGSVAASRLARATKADGTSPTVCVLEKGQEIRPGEFPSDLVDAAKQMHMDHHTLGEEGRRDGLFQFRINPEVTVVAGCGLGGTSLINASVGMEADPRIFRDARWPAALRDDVEDGLAAGRERARRMLDLQTFPSDRLKPTKLEVLEKTARANDWPCYKAPLHVNFQERPGQKNHVGVVQPACHTCGDCTSGCNVGAKGTLLMNYLPDAARHGASIYCGADVRFVEKKDGAWHVHYRPTTGSPSDGPTRFVKADMVILAASALGTTEILLRSRQRGLALSDWLGERLTGNGDFVGFGYNCDDPVHGVGWGNLPDARYPPAGPCITGIIDTRARESNVDDGMLVEEGSVPGLLGPLLAGSLRGVAVLEGHGLPKDLAAGARIMASWPWGGERRGAVDHTLLYLVMSHDDGRGSLRLVKDRLRVEWPSLRKNPTFERVIRRLETATQPLGGVFLKEPIWSKPFGNASMTVHPLGGCAMGENTASGVVNHKGQVFEGGSHDTVHPGLLVMDGAVMPRPLGVNPLLTITALAERNVALLIKDQGWTVHYHLDDEAPDLVPAGPRPIGLRFSERMTGWLSPPTGAPGDFVGGWKRGDADGTSLSFTIDVESYSLDDLLDPHRDHRAVITGTMDAPWLSPSPLTIRNGTFNLFAPDPTRVETCRMLYRMRLEAEDGALYYLQGFKEVRHDPATQMWDATTTLYTTLHEGRDDAGPVRAEGILRISVTDLARTVRSIQATHAPDLAAHLAAEARFTGFFVGALWEHYGGMLAPLSTVVPHAPATLADPALPPAEVHPVVTSDGVHLSLCRFRGGAKGPVILAGGFGMSSLAWHVATLQPSFARFLVDRGYDVWCFDYRASPALPSARIPFTVDDVALRDWPAAIEVVKRISGRDTVQVVGHCVGSMSILMALCAGAANGVRSLVSSQTTLHLQVPRLAKAEATVHLAEAFRWGGLDVLTTSPGTTVAGHALDLLLKAFPVPPGQGCRSPVCHRIFALYGPVYDHQNLDDATHDVMGDLFGVANVGTFEHLTAMIRKGHVVDARGGEAYLPHLSRLKLPITFLVGENNTFFFPAGARQTFDALVACNGASWYDYQLLPGYAHLDCFIGRNAASHVWPTVLQALEAHP